MPEVRAPRSPRDGSRTASWRRQTLAADRRRSCPLRHDTTRFPNVPRMPRLGCGKLSRHIWTSRARRCH